LILQPHFSHSPASCQCLTFDAAQKDELLREQGRVQNESKVARLNIKSTFYVIGTYMYFVCGACGHKQKGLLSRKFTDVIHLIFIKLF